MSTTTSDGYRPNLTRKWPTPYHEREPIEPDPPPFVPARYASDEEKPDVVVALEKRLTDAGYRVLVAYAESHAHKATVTVYASKPGAVALTSWELTGERSAKTGRPMGKRESNHLWPHKGRATSLLGATAWTNLVCPTPPKKPRKKREPKS